MSTAKAARALMRAANPLPPDAFADLADGPEF